MFESDLTTIRVRIVQTGVAKKNHPIHYKDPTPKNDLFTLMHHRSSQSIQHERDIVASRAQTVYVTSRRRQRKSRVAGSVLSLHLQQHRHAT